MHFFMEAETQAESITHVSHILSVYQVLFLTSLLFINILLSAYHSTCHCCCMPTRPFKTHTPLEKQSVPIIFGPSVHSETLQAILLYNVPLVFRRYFKVCSINWLAVFCGSGLLNKQLKETVRFAGLTPPMSA